jgi:hypothetical protein
VEIVDYVVSSGLVGSGSSVYSFGRPCVADLNGDAILDIVWSQHNKAPKNVYLGVPDGGVEWPIGTQSKGGGFLPDSRTVWAIHDQHSCAVADFDGDGRMDLFESSGACSGRCLKWDEFFLQAADGSFVSAIGHLGPPTMDRSRESVVLDVDRDGLPDLFIAAARSANGSHHRVLRNLGPDGSGNWQGFGEILTGVEQANGPSPCAAVADIDADGWSDVAVCEGNGLVLFRNVGGVFQRHAFQLGGTTVRGLEFADFDADGLLDLAVVRATEVEVRRNGGGGTFATTLFSATVATGWDVVAPDIDGDGDRDLFVSQIVTGRAATSTGAHSLWLNPATGGGVWQRIPVPQPARGGGDKVAVFPDFRGSGRDALLVSNGGGAKLSVFGISTSGAPGPRQVLAVSGL